MNKHRALALALILSLALACSFSLGSSPTATPVPSATAAATNTAASTETPPQDDIATLVAQTMGAQGPAPTEVIPPTQPPAQPTSGPAVTVSPGNWFGSFRWFGPLYPLTFTIIKVTGSTFTGTMYWHTTQCQITERVEGDIIQDITTATEQNRWQLHPDYQSGDRSGAWLRWTQNESIGGTRCYLTISGDWWYAHLRSDHHLFGIHFTNDTNTEPDKDATFDFAPQ